MVNGGTLYLGSRVNGSIYITLPLCCLFFFDIRFLIASLVASNSFYLMVIKIPLGISSYAHIFSSQIGTDMVY
jgi:hypothetical protein